MKTFERKFIVNLFSISLTEFWRGWGKWEWKISWNSSKFPLGRALESFQSVTSMARIHLTLTTTPFIELFNFPNFTASKISSITDGVFTELDKLIQKPYDQLDSIKFKHTPNQFQLNNIWFCLILVTIQIITPP